MENEILSFGRKPKYRKEFCQRIIDLARAGKGSGMFCVMNNITRSTFYNWKKQYKDFADATDLADMALEEYHIELLNKAAFKMPGYENIQPALVLKLVEIHSEKARTKQQPVAPSINVNITNPALENKELTPEERQQRLKELLDKAAQDKKDKECSRISSDSSAQ